MHVGHDRGQLRVGVLEHRLQAVGQARPLLDQVGAVAPQVAQVPLREEAATLALLDTVPGIGRRAAQLLVAEPGTDLTRFPSAEHVAS